MINDHQMTPGHSMLGRYPTCQDTFLDPRDISASLVTLGDAVLVRGRDNGAEC